MSLNHQINHLLTTKKDLLEPLTTTIPTITIWRRIHTRMRIIIPHIQQEGILKHLFIQAKLDQIVLNLEKMSIMLHYNTCEHSRIQPSTNRIGSIADYDPINEQYGSIAQQKRAQQLAHSTGQRPEVSYQVIF
ncbi:hypothetical protein Anas_07308 [Armadillidium nasatum]|uniref:Uncharacterized protein n=1 Tax=Armadillidium nasatum TaxID=96803 RepID=A0A5N5TKX6_9CRUS|nr:hypothetical protein Anas_07308 [Armadillidium nasatum]